MHRDISPPEKAPHSLTGRYVPIAELLDSNSELPLFLDAVVFDYREVRCRVYGVLHGLSGGTNAQYRRMVERTIQAAPGLKFGETQFKRLYKGLDVEMDDWLEIRLRDAFRMQLTMSLMPLHLVRVAMCQRRERKAAEDRFGACGARRIQDIGGSPAFHSLSPTERRRIAGFPPPHEYLLENCRQRQGTGRFSAPVFPDPDWFWMARIEPHANIPLRSIHMLEYAVEQAKARGAHEVSIFVGEMHNSDMDWYAAWDPATESDEVVRKTVARTVARARTYALSSRKASKLAFVLSALAGTFMPMAGYLIVVLAAIRLLHR